MEDLKAEKRLITNLIWKFTIIGFLIALIAIINHNSFYYITSSIGIIFVLYNLITLIKSLKRTDTLLKETKKSAEIIA